MAGLALGNALAAWIGPRVANPVRAYAYTEAVIALTGVGLVYLFPVMGAALAPVFRPLLDQPWLLNPLRLLVAFVLLLIPATAMGITLPLLVTAIVNGIRDPGLGIRKVPGSRIPNPESPVPESFGRVIGWLYGWNTLGAMAGVVAGEMFLLGRFGVRGTALAAGALNLLAAAIAGLLAGWSVRRAGFHDATGATASWTRHQVACCDVCGGLRPSRPRSDLVSLPAAVRQRPLECICRDARRGACRDRARGAGGLALATSDVRRISLRCTRSHFWQPWRRSSRTRAFRR